MRRFALLPVLLATLLGAPPAHAWTWPMDGPVLRPFLFGNDPYAAGLHRGIDIGAAPGTAVRAPRAGLVRFVGTVPGNGRTLTIETADGYSVTLLHLGALSVARGATVAEGDPVAVVGPSDGIEHQIPSVHLGVRVTVDPQGYVDPLPLLPAVAPAVPEASEPEPPSEPGPSVPETPSEAPDTSEPEPPAEEPVGQPHLPVQVPATSVLHPVHAPAVETAAEPPTAETSVPGTAAPPTVRPRSAPVAESVVPAAPPARAGRKGEAVAHTESAAPSAASTRTLSLSPPVAPPTDAPATRTERESAGRWLPALMLAAVLLAALLGMGRRLVRRRSSQRAYPARAVRLERASPADAPQPAIESARPRKLTETALRERPLGRSWLRPSPDRSGPRPDRGRAAPRRRATRQPVSVVGTRTRR